MKKALDGPVGNVAIRTYSGTPNLAGGIAVKQGVSGDRTCLAVTAAGQQCIGITREGDLGGDGIYGVVTFGETPGTSGAALACDIDVIVDVNGCLVPSVAQGDFVLGRTRTSCAESGDEVIVNVHPYTR